MKLSASRRVLMVVAALVVSLLLAAIAWQATSQNGDTASSSDMINSATGTPSTDPTGQPTEAVADPAITDALPNDSLGQQIRRFVEAYYLIEANDSQETRRQRVTGLGNVSAEALQSLSFALSAGEIEYQQFGIRQHAELDTRTVAATQLSDQAVGPWQASAPVTIVWTDSGGNHIGSDEVWTISEWQFDGANWTLNNFSPEGGG